MYKAYYSSPIGSIEIVSDESSILELEFVEEMGQAHDKAPEVLKRALTQLDEYFKGKRKAFDLELKLKGTEFQKGVWQQLQKVPYGNTASYGDIAKAVGNEKASRAVGGANNKNKIAIIIPCHRIVGSKGEMTGYAGGIWRKEWLLQHEKSNI
ncbi:MAG: methylated-DNA--[protein]-cysteine S-methyltransferase [Clostridia bacterium]|jgi:methylated-DNA-[protein]-cysteine S-methyltransferase|nr:methylated-DNA--[protein]-cysteine S-methyltransferase [Clostridia bacterium]